MYLATNKRPTFAKTFCPKFGSHKLHLVINSRKRQIKYNLSQKYATCKIENLRFTKQVQLRQRFVR